MKFFVKLFLSAFLVFSVPFSVGAQDDVVVTKQYDDGGMYEGTFKNGLQHGIGTYRLPNGYEYSGEWVDGEILGVGVAKFPNGSVYEGNFIKGKPEGSGKIIPRMVLVVLRGLGVLGIVLLVLQVFLVVLQVVLAVAVVIL